MNPTDALASLAFTGHSSALSSSALAALTSRLTHRASSELLTASSVRGSSKKPKHGTHLDVPPWTAAFSVTPIERSAKSSIEEGVVTGGFDPYAEARHDVRKERSSLSLLHPLREKRSSRESPPQESDAARTLARRPARRENSPNTLRRWTLAMADVPDEVLVQELEKLRMGGRGAANSANGSPVRRRRKRSSRAVESSELGHDDDWKMVGEESSSGYSADERDPSPAPSTSHLNSHSPSSSNSNQLHSVAHLSSLDDHEWKTARRALLCCRELVRTERNYQARLRVLLSGETSTPPPGLVLTYVPALLRASEALLSRLEDDPSAWGVSAGFVAVEEEVEAAFVAWAGVVGEIFVGSSEESRERVGRKLTRSSRNSSVSSVSDSANKSLGKRSRSGASIAHARMESIYRKRGISMIEPEPLSPPASRPVSTANSTMGMFTAALGTGLAYGISPSAQPTQSQDELARPRITTTPNGSAGTLSRTFGAFKTKKSSFSSSTSLSPHAYAPASPVSPGFSFMSGSKEDEKEKEREKKPGVRELAILPVQRVMRYVLQYRGEPDRIANSSRGMADDEVRLAGEHAYRKSVPRPCRACARERDAHCREMRPRTRQLCVFPPPILDTPLPSHSTSP